MSPLRGERRLSDVRALLDGEPLLRRLERSGRLPADEAVTIARQIAVTVGAAHARGVVHLGLTPDNVFLARDRVTGREHALVIDATDDIADGDRDPAYRSPEQCRGSGEVDRRADVYALGCVLYHMLVGRPPFVAEHPEHVSAMHVGEPPAPPSAVLPQLDPSLDGPVLRCLAKSPAERPVDMDHVAAALDRASHATGPRTTQEICIAAARASTRRAWTPLRAGLAAAVMIAVLVMVAAFALP